MNLDGVKVKNDRVVGGDSDNADEAKQATTQRYEVTYDLRSSTDGSVVHTGACVVTARSEDEAERKAVDWAHGNDPYADSRIDPIVEIYNVTEIDEEDEDGEKDSGS
jgi:hypothetical protein